jgi:gluconolactonase
MRWAEGPVYFPEERYVLVSDIPNNRIMKYSEKDGSFTVFRSPPVSKGNAIEQN